MKSILKLVATMLFLAAAMPPAAADDTTACVVVVGKDGKTVSHPLAATDRIALDALSFTVYDKDGKSTSHEYETTDRILIGAAAGALDAKLIADAQLAVWPTVTSSVLHVSGQIPAVSIYSTAGALMETVQLPGDGSTADIDVSAYAPGAYIIAAPNQPSVKFIKK